jgi:hypothetical protein
LRKPTATGQSPGTKASFTLRRGIAHGKHTRTTDVEAPRAECQATRDGQAALPFARGGGAGAHGRAQGDHRGSQGQNGADGPTCPDAQRGPVQAGGCGRCSRHVGLGPWGERGPSHPLPSRRGLLCRVPDDPSGARLKHLHRGGGPTPSGRLPTRAGTPLPGGPGRRNPSLPLAVAPRIARRPAARGRRPRPAEG